MRVPVIPCGFALLHTPSASSKIIIIIMMDSYDFKLLRCGMGTFIIIFLWKKTFRRAKRLAWAVGCISVYAKERGGYLKQEG